MSTFLLFMVVCFVFFLGLSVLAFYPWLVKLVASKRTGTATKQTKPAQQTKQARHTERDNALLALNVTLFEQRLAELDDDFAQGALEQVEYHAQKVELQRQLLAASDDLLKRQSTDSSSGSGLGGEAELAGLSTTKVALGLLVMPVLVVMGFLGVQDRSAVFELWQAQARMHDVAKQMLVGEIQRPPAKFAQGDAAKNTTELLQSMQVQVHQHAHEPQYWLNLSKAYMAIQDMPAATLALQRAHRLAPQSHDIAMTYAQVRFFSQGTLDATTRKVLSGVLKAQPHHEGAHMLMAMGEVKAQNYTQAQHWVGQLKYALTQKGGDRSKALASLAELEGVIAQKMQQTQAGQVVVRVRMVADAKLRLKLDTFTSAATLFVTARAKAGGPPYAVKRYPLSQVKSALLGAGVLLTLSDADSMMPAHSLSSAKRGKIPLVLTAKISQSGVATTQSGDLHSKPQALSEPKPQDKARHKTSGSQAHPQAGTHTQSALEPVVLIIDSTASE